MKTTARKSLTTRAVCLLGVSLGALAPGAASASAATLVVDNDGQQCKNAHYGSISAAVAAAGAGDRIKVCPGLYTETVVVDKPGLRLRAKGGNARDCFGSTAEPADPARDAIVTGGPQTAAFNLQADDVALRGFVVQGNNMGIRASGAFSGYRIRDNLLDRNDFGLLFGSNGEQRSRVTRNCFRSNGRGPVGGGIFGIAGLAGPLHDAEIAHNYFFRNTFGIRLGASSDIDVTHNRSLSDGTWMRNGGTVDITVAHNTVRSALGANASDAIVFFPLGGVAGGAPNAGAVVSHNDLSDNGRDGVQVQPSGLVSSVISHNSMSDNGRDGIRIESPGNTGNLVEHNRLGGNQEHDCHDDTVGSGTAGTANVWENNRADSENRPGLCRGESKEGRR